MNCIEHTLAELRKGLIKALPGRIISDDFINHSERNHEELVQGVVTVLLQSIQLQDDWVSSLKLTIIGQVLVPTREGMPHDAEVAEQKLYHELRRYLRNARDLPAMSIDSVKFSAQIEHPFGWVVLDVLCGPVDESSIEKIGWPEEIYPPGIEVGELKEGHFDIDLEPHESDEEHQKWLQGDYSHSQPEAQIDMEFKHADD